MRMLRLGLSLRHAVVEHMPSHAIAQAEASTVRSRRLRGPAFRRHVGFDLAVAHPLLQRNRAGQLDADVRANPT